MENALTSKNMLPALIGTLVLVVLAIGVLLMAGGLSHLKEGHRAGHRNTLAAKVAEATNPPPPQCWERPAINGSPARALVWNGSLNVTFLWNLSNGDVTFMEGDVPGDQAADYEADPRTGIPWRTCTPDEAGRAGAKLIEALNFMGF